MYRLLMIITLVAAFKIFIAYLVAKIKSCKKNTISAEELIQFKGITRKQYEERVAPIMWDNESYYEQLKLNIYDNKVHGKSSNYFYDEDAKFYDEVLKYDDPSGDC